MKRFFRLLLLAFVLPLWMWVFTGAYLTGFITGVWDATACTGSTATSGADKVSCFQGYVNLANALGGGKVIVGSGYANLKSQLIIKTNVTLECVASGYQYGNFHLLDASLPSYTPVNGTIFAVLWGSGSGAHNDATKAAVQVQSDAKVLNCSWWYPLQDYTASTPTEYGPTILAAGVLNNTNQEVANNTCMICYDFIDFRGGTFSTGCVVNADIHNNSGSPIFYGIAINSVCDWSMIHHNNFNSGAIYPGDPSPTSDLLGWIAAHGTVLYVNHQDTIHFDAIQAWGYNCGLCVDYTTSEYPGDGPVTLSNSNFDATQIGVSYIDASATSGGQSSASSSSGTTLTIGGTVTGTFVPGMMLMGANIPGGIVIESNGTGSGGAGTYILNRSLSLSSQAITAGFGIDLLRIDHSSFGVGNPYGVFNGVGLEVNDHSTMYSVQFIDNEINNYDSNSTAGFVIYGYQTNQSIQSVIITGNVSTGWAQSSPAVALLGQGGGPHTLLFNDNSFPNYSSTIFGNTGVNKNPNQATTNYN